MSTTAVLEKPSLMDLSLSELISEAIALGGEKVHDMAKAMGHVRHKKTWIAVIESIEIEPIIIGTETDIPFSDDEDDEDDDEEIENGDRTDEEIELIYSVIPGDRTISFKEIWEKVNLPSGELAGKLLELELAERVIQEPYNNYRRLAINCPPPPPPPTITRPCPIPERIDIPGIEIAKEENCRDVGSERRECKNTYEKPCTTCDGSGLLDKNLTCINCNGKGWRNREEQLTINIRNICRTFIADLHDSVFPWTGNMQCTQWKEIMNEVATARWTTVAGQNIWQLCERVRELYKYCDDRKPNHGPLSPALPDIIKRIDENHWLLLLIFFEASGNEFADGDYSAINAYHIPHEKYDKWKVLGKVELFILPNEMQEDNVIDAHYVEDYLALRGAE